MPAFIHRKMGSCVDNQIQTATTEQNRTLGAYPVEQPLLYCPTTYTIHCAVVSPRHLQKALRTSKNSSFHCPSRSPKTQITRHPYYRLTKFKAPPGAENQINMTAKKQLLKWHYFLLIWFRKWLMFACIDDSCRSIPNKGFFMTHRIIKEQEILQYQWKFQVLVYVPGNALQWQNTIRFLQNCYGTVLAMTVWQRVTSNPISRERHMIS